MQGKGAFNSSSSSSSGRGGGGSNSSRLPPIGGGYSSSGGSGGSGGGSNSGGGMSPMVQSPGAENGTVLAEYCAKQVAEVEKAISSGTPGFFRISLTQQ